MGRTGGVLESLSDSSAVVEWSLIIIIIIIIIVIVIVTIIVIISVNLSQSSSAAGLKTLKENLTQLVCKVYISNMLPSTRSATGGEFSRPIQEWVSDNWALYAPGKGKVKEGTLPHL